MPPAGALGLGKQKVAVQSTLAFTSGLGLAHPTPVPRPPPPRGTLAEPMEVDTGTLQTDVGEVPSSVS